MATAKQRIFINEYLKCWNATEAARRAEYASPNTAGNRLLLNDGIREEIDQRLEQLKLGADEVLIKLSEMGRGFDITKYISFEDRYARGKDGELYFVGEHMKIDLEKLQGDGYSHLIKRIKQNAKGYLDIEWHDQMVALINLGKHHKLFTDRVDLTSGGKPLNEVLQEAANKVYGEQDGSPDND